jgi:hypothetical protein
MVSSGCYFLVVRGYTIVLIDRDKEGNMLHISTDAVRHSLFIILCSMFTALADRVAPAHFT